MNYIVIEIQTTGGVTGVVPPATYANEAEAKRAYHLAIAAAIVSAVEVHTIVLMTTEGQILAREVCRHPATMPEE